MGEVETKAQDVPYIVHESIIARLDNSYKEQIDKLHKAYNILGIITIILIVLFVLTNAGWIYYENQYVDTETSIEATQDGDVNIVGGRDVDYGTESQSNS